MIVERSFGFSSRMLGGGGTLIPNLILEQCQFEVPELFTVRVKCHQIHYILDVVLFFKIHGKSLIKKWPRINPCGHLLW